MSAAFRHPFHLRDSGIFGTQYTGGERGAMSTAFKQAMARLQAAAALLEHAKSDPIQAAKRQKTMLAEVADADEVKETIEEERQEDSDSNSNSDKKNSSSDSDSSTSSSSSAKNRKKRKAIYAKNRYMLEF